MKGGEGREEAQEELRDEHYLFQGPWILSSSSTLGLFFSACSLP
jgi:hypothetical protein